jgi:hypothetical protein
VGGGATPAGVRSFGPKWLPEQNCKGDAKSETYGYKRPKGPPLSQKGYSEKIQTLAGPPGWR